MTYLSIKDVGILITLPRKVRIKHFEIWRKLMHRGLISEKEYNEARLYVYIAEKEHRANMY